MHNSSSCRVFTKLTEIRRNLISGRAVLLSAMDYSPADLKKVDEHIAQGERHILRQEELLTWMRSRGLPTETAEELLGELVATLKQHRDHRNRMIEGNPGF